MCEVRGGAEELRAVEVDDGALADVRVVHKVAHPHVAVADRVEAGAERVARAAELHQQLEDLVGDLAQLDHVLLDACKKMRLVRETISLACVPTGKSSDK